MLIKYDQSELEAAILNAVFGAYITSPYDPQMVEAAMGKPLTILRSVPIKKGALIFTMIAAYRCKMARECRYCTPVRM